MGASAAKKIRTIHGEYTARGRRFGIVVSRFNESITRRLVDGALDALVRHGVALADTDVIWVPGAWELPVAVPFTPPPPPPP